MHCAVSLLVDARSGLPRSNGADVSAEPPVAGFQAVSQSFTTPSPFASFSAMPLADDDSASNASDLGETDAPEAKKAPGVPLPL